MTSSPLSSDEILDPQKNHRLIDLLSQWFPLKTKFELELKKISIHNHSDLQAHCDTLREPDSMTVNPKKRDPRFPGAAPQHLKVLAIEPLHFQESQRGPWRVWLCTFTDDSEPWPWTGHKLVLKFFLDYLKLPPSDGHALYYRHDANYGGWCPYYEAMSYAELPERQGKDIPYSYGMFQCEFEYDPFDHVRKSLGLAHLMEYIPGPTLSECIRLNLHNDAVLNQCASMSYYAVLAINEDKPKNRKIHPDDIILYEPTDASSSKARAVVTNIRTASAYDVSVVQAAWEELIKMEPYAGLKAVKSLVLQPTSSPGGT